MKSGWDRLAPAYRALETLGFGPLLQRARCAWIDRLADRKSILLLGEGNGRFLARALETAQQARFTIVDASEGMIAAAKRRIGEAADRVDFIRAKLPEDLATIETNGPFDSVAAHFFFDCFPDDEVQVIVEKVTGRTTPDALWLVSEFHVPDSPAWKRIYSAYIVRGLYLAFRVMTGLKTRKLPQWQSAMSNAGWVQTDIRKRSPTLIKAEVWEKTEID